MGEKSKTAFWIDALTTRLPFSYSVAGNSQKDPWREITESMAREIADELQRLERHNTKLQRQVTELEANMGEKSDAKCGTELAVRMGMLEARIDTLENEGAQVIRAVDVAGELNRIIEKERRIAVLVEQLSGKNSKKPVGK